MIPAGLADTSLFIAAESGRRLRTDDLPAMLTVSVITLGELRVGVLAAEDDETRARRLSTLTAAASFGPMPISATVAEAWADLRQTLRRHGRSMPINDSWIAATALAHGVPVVTQDDDYDDIPGLDVIRA
ncbi:MAG: type II toxin-antitoxin system VapC family toxin [Actinomycetota bacterium]